MDFTSQDIPLKALSLHERNVRARSPETYEDESIGMLAASIAAVGLIQPLIVIKTDKGKYGVLAGGRRLAALKQLAADKAVKAFKSTTPVSCRVIPEGTDLASALSLAENVTQAPMKPIDEFDAFAAMSEEGLSVGDIAKTFGIEERRVHERLRYGRIAAPIREACRAREINLDTMKAFAGHPDPEVQLAVYEELQASGDLYSYKVRNALENRGVRASDALAELVRTDYDARGGNVITDLEPDHSVLTDQPLVEAILDEKLRAAAEEARAAHGFAWADIMIDPEWGAMHKFGRVHAEVGELSKTDQAKLDAMDAELSELEERSEACDPNDEEYWTIGDRYEALEAERDAFLEAAARFSPEDAARAGVIAVWQGGEIRLHPGLVKPPEKAGSTDGDGATTAVDKSILVIKDAMQSDLGTERAIALGAAMTSQPALAQDVILYLAITGILGRGNAASHAITLSARFADLPHSRADEIDPTARETIHACRDGIDLVWLDEERPDARFAAFQALGAETKAQLTALAMAHMISPGLARPIKGWGDDLMALLEPVIMPDIRDHWRPTGPAFFSRIPKAQLLRIIAEDLEMPEEAANLVTAKKAEINDFLERLFADPFATLTPNQLAAVERWTPPGMQTLPYPDAEADADGSGVNTSEIDTIEEDDPSSGNEAEPVAVAAE